MTPPCDKRMPGGPSDCGPLGAAAGGGGGGAEGEAVESLAREAAVFAAAGDHPNCPGARPGRLSTLLSVFHGASLSYGHSLFAKAAAGSA
jgi:hypothetical protein